MMDQSGTPFLNQSDHRPGENRAENLRRGERKRKRTEMRSFSRGRSDAVECLQRNACDVPLYILESEQQMMNVIVYVNTL
jgi:hypothetical protein